MDAKELRELIEIISRSEFSTFELEKDGFKLKLVKGGAAAPARAALEKTPVRESAPPSVAPAAEAPEVGPPSSPAPAAGLYEVPSPIVGTFYRAPSPGADPFVEIGARVRKGQVLCLIEAMKLMNEIEADIDAEVVEICVQNAQPVEFGEVLFRLRPLA